MMHLQASDDILRVSGEVPDDGLREKSQPGPSTQTPAKPELASGNSAPAIKPAGLVPQQGSSGVEPVSTAADAAQHHPPSAEEALGSQPSKPAGSQAPPQVT